MSLAISASVTLNVFACVGFAFDAFAFDPDFSCGTEFAATSSEQDSSSDEVGVEDVDMLFLCLGAMVGMLQDLFCVCARISKVLSTTAVEVGLCSAGCPVPGGNCDERREDSNQIRGVMPGTQCV